LVVTDAKLMQKCKMLSYSGSVCKTQNSVLKARIHWLNTLCQMLESLGWLQKVKHCCVFLVRKVISNKKLVSQYSLRILTFWLTLVHYYSSRFTDLYSLSSEILQF
jgi:hypothetical protein